MKTIETILGEEISQLRKVIEAAKQRLNKAPKGYLRISKKRGGVEYYYKSEGESNNKGKNSNNGRYIRKEEINIVKAIAQRDYDLQVVKRAEERIKAISNFMEKYKKTNLAEAYQQTNSYRRKLIFPAAISDEEFIKQWQTVEYKGKPFVNDENEIITEKGERVRSKSEKIIADKLFALGIPYRYEYPLILEENIKIYPDFTILRMPMREEVYLEHFGMMDDANYVNTVICKLSTFERNGIYLGVNLFVTYETSKRTLNTRVLDELIKELFCIK